VKLGNPRPETAGFHDRMAASVAGARSGATRSAAANELATLLRPLLEGELAGLSANATAGELNQRGVQMLRGGRWTARSVLNLRTRLK
jgi:hypothetical protein